MAILLSPVLNEQQFDANGNPLSGGKIHTYLAGTTTPVTTYKTSAGTAQANPIVLDSSGNFTTGTQLWLDSGKTYKFVVTDANDVTLRTVDNITPINDVNAVPDEWVQYTTSAFTYISATSFSVVGDQTGTFVQYRRIKTTNTGGTVYSTISASSYSAGSTTVTVANDSGTLDSGLSAVYYGVLSPSHSSIPERYITTKNLSFDSGPFGFRNRVINGAMSIDQRNSGAAQTITAAAALAYSVDRWYAYCTGANVTGQRVAGTAPNQYNYSFTGAASVTKIGYAQRIEAANCQDLAGQTATLSVDLANSLLTTVTWTAWYANTTDTFGTLASPTRTQIATGTFTVNSTLTRYNAQISIPSAATTGIEIEFSVGAQTSGTWTIGRAQLESGAVATPFEYRFVGTELASCYRYYAKFNYAGTGASFSSIISMSVKHPATMRVDPSINYTINSQSGNAAGWPTVSAVDAGSSAFEMNPVSANTDIGANVTVFLSAEL